MPYPMFEIVENTLRGIEKAQKDYERWSGGNWLYQAPEYLMTTYVAKELATHKEHSYYITLEHSTADAVAEAGGMGSGKPRIALRLNGRFDILLWCSNKSPRAIIEVKKHISQYEHISDDIARMCDVLEPHNTVGHGIMAYYSAHHGESRKRALRDFLFDRVQLIESRAQNYVQKRGLNLQGYHKSIKVVYDRAWVPGVLQISRG